MLSLGLGCLAFFGLSLPAQAETIDDSYISSASIDSVSSQTRGATATYTLSFTNTTLIPSGEELGFHAVSSTGCGASDPNTCYPLLSNATLSGLSGERSDGGSSNYVGFRLSADLVVGSHTVILSLVTNPSSAAVVRVMMQTTASNEEILLGSTFSNQNWYATASSQVTFGTPLVYGTVVSPDGHNMPDTSINLHNENWSAYGYSNTDSEGYYTIFQDYFTAGYWSAGSLTISASPNGNSDFLATEAELNFDGSTGQAANITLDPSVYFFSGSVTYGSNHSTTVQSQAGDPVTNASLYFYPQSGGTGYSANTDESGNYTVAVRPGTYSLSMNLDWSDEDQDQDWVYSDMSRIFAISSAGTVTENIEVTQTTSRLRGSISASDGTVVQGSLTLSNETNSYSTSLESDGSYTLNLNPGVFTVSFYPYVGEDENAARYYLPAESLTVAEGNAEYSPELSEKNASLEVTVTDQDGLPLPNAQIGASQENEWVGEQTDANGQATLWLQSAVTYQVYVSLEGYIYNEPSIEVKVSANETETLAFTLASPDASINVTVRDANGELPENAYGYVSCSPEDYSTWFGGSITNGVGTVYLSLEDGAVFEGLCNLWMNDEDLGAASALDVTVADGEVGQLEFTLAERSAEVVVHVKEIDGKLVKNATHGQINVWNEESKVWQNAELDASGKTTIRVVPGTYVGGVWFEDRSYIPLWSKNNGQVTVAANESGNLVLTVVEASAQVTGTVTDPNGDPVEHGWAFCGNWDEVSVQGDFEDGTVIDSGAEIENGSFSMALVAGHDYRCNVGAPPEFVEQGWMQPADVELSINDEGTDIPDLNFAFSEADSRIKGSLTWPTETASAAQGSQHAWCWAWGEDGGHSFAEAKSDGTFTLSVQSGSTWNYGCDSQDGQTWLTTGQNSVEVSEAGITHSDLKLSEFSAWHIYNPTSQTFDATESTVINLEDGTVLTIPANAIASSGEVTVTATPESNIVYTGDSMLGIPWNFEAFLDGELVETFNSEVTIEIPYTDDTLDEFGVDEDSLTSKYYDESSGTWKTTDNVTQNKSVNTITVSTNHFTQYGVTFSSDLTDGLQPAKPKKLVSSDETAKAAKLNWKKGSDKKVTQYVVQVRPKGDSKKSHWRTFDSVKGKTKTVKKLDNNTKYQFRVKACNSGFCSEYSDWKKFKTEK